MTVRVWTTGLKSLYGFCGGFVRNIFVDRHSQTPVHLQIKEQVRFLCLQQKLGPGDALPSIRKLAHQLDVGSGIVRRAYRELCHEGLLRTENREHVVRSAAAADAATLDLVRASERQCARLIAWAAKHGASAVALARLFRRHALAKEAVAPSYAFVDVCRLAAERSALKVAQAWDVKVAGIALGDFNAGQGIGGRRTLTTVLVNEHLYEEAIAVDKGHATRLFSVRIRLDDRLKQRLNRLPAKSRVALVCADRDFALVGRALLRFCANALGRKRRVEVMRLGDVRELASLFPNKRAQLFLFTPLVWETLPTQIKRLPAMVPAFTEPDPQSLDEIRVPAGILL